MTSQNERTYQNRTRAESFGRRADTYDRVRPSYPAALVDDLIALGPIDVLDVGCGTGRVAGLLAARGVSVLGVEIDAQMAAVARGNGIAVEVGGFETWDAAGRYFDLIVSGQAWHWIDPAAGAEKAVELLRPGGSLALFWNFGDFEERLRPAFDQVYAQLAPSVTNSTVGGGHRGVESGAEALLAAGFTSWQHRTYEWHQHYSRDEWLALLSTHSDHSTLPPATLARLLPALGEVIDAHGGSITIPYTTELLLAAR